VTLTSTGTPGNPEILHGKRWVTDVMIF
jgi:hypothetical protein